MLAFLTSTPPPKKPQTNKNKKHQQHMYFQYVSFQIIHVIHGYIFRSALPFSVLEISFKFNT